jgi:hypothetical protein
MNATMGTGVYCYASMRVTEALFGNWSSRELEAMIFSIGPELGYVLNQQWKATGFTR